MTLFRFFQFPDSLLTFSCLLVGTFGYYIFNLKEYYVGEYYIPIVNSVDEGSIFIHFGYLIHSVHKAFLQLKILGWKIA